MTTKALVVRSMTAADVAMISVIEKEVFSDPWPTSAFRELLGVANRVNLVMEIAGEIVGYVLAQCVADEVQIQNIAVRQAWQRRGFGAILLRRAEEEGQVHGALCSILDVRAQNVAALALYERFGYRMIGRRRSYYQRPEDDALILFRRLDLAPGATPTQDRDDGMVS
jgi:ribosomal-protein-alanine N-acetyltransferase